MLPPDTLLQNRYLVLEQIGKGGMGVVYKATDQRFGSLVALKEIFLDAPHLRKAFEREARLLNHLRHPALPRVSDHFTDDDGQFIVMEFIPGADLWETLKEKRVPFPLASALNWADQLLDALDYLHNHEPSIIHRDIKPQNLKLTTRNHIVLLDFGLAKGAPSQASRATETASVFGYSYHYAPLEQMQGTGTDVRSDLYSLGATLYHLMTNVAPPDALSRATAVLNGQPDPLRSADKVQAQVSAPVARVLMNAMAQNAAQRPATAAAMREALREASRQTSAAVLNARAEPFAVAEALELQQGTRLGAARSTEPLTERHALSVAALPQDAMTVVQPAVAASRPRPSRRRNDEHDSVVTRVRDTRTPEPRASTSALKLSIAASVALLVIAAAIFAFMRPPRASAPSVQAAAAPSDPATLANESAGVQTQAPALSTQQTAAPAPSSQPAVSASNNSPQGNPTADNQSSQPTATDAAGQPKSQAQPQATDAASVALTPEAERARQAEEIRRQRREQDAEYIKRERDEIDRERERELQRSAQQQQPQLQPPAGFPPPPPPPRRGGPPPF
jgi:serine/threonine protein kinase